MTRPDAPSAHAHPPSTRGQAPIWRRRAGDLLRTWREDANIRPGEAAKIMGWTGDRMGRIERGTYKIREDDIRTLCAHYGVVDETAIAELVQVSSGVFGHAWYAKYEKRLPPHAVDAFWLYTQSETITSHHPTAVNWALQDLDYARKIWEYIRAAGIESEFTVNEFVELRLGMKSIFYNQGRLKSFTAYIPEISLEVREPFGKEATRRQLQALLAPPHHPDLQVLVVPTVSAGHALSGGAVNISTFRHPWPDSVYVESPPVVDPVGGPSRVEVVRQWMEPVFQSALTHEESTDAIAHYLKKCE